MTVLGHGGGVFAGAEALDAGSLVLVLLVCHGRVGEGVRVFLSAGGSAGEGLFAGARPCTRALYWLAGDRTGVAAACLPGLVRRRGDCSWTRGRGLCHSRGLVPRGRPGVGAACLPGSGRRGRSWSRVWGLCGAGALDAGPLVLVLAACLPWSGRRGGDGVLIAGEGLLPGPCPRRGVTVLGHG